MWLSSSWRTNPAALLSSCYYSSYHRQSTGTATVMSEPCAPAWGRRVVRWGQSGDPRGCGAAVLWWCSAYATEKLGGEEGVSQPPPPMGHRCVLQCILKNIELLHRHGNGWLYALKIEHLRVDAVCCRDPMVEVVWREIRLKTVTSVCYVITNDKQHLQMQYLFVFWIPTKSNIRIAEPCVRWSMHTHSTVYQ